VKTFHCNGQVKSSVLYVGMNPVGQYQEWYENGQLSVEGQFDEVSAWPNDGNDLFSEKQGEWKFYSQSGELIRTEKYKDGIPIH
ncbi:MAG: toxin-antitoxin system YwqK family antitoxin, partial [Bacteroidia bacterium]